MSGQEEIMEVEAHSEDPKGDTRLSNASENVLEDLSVASIGALRNLQRLNVAHNRLRELPVATFESRALEELDARGNLIETIKLDSDDEKLPVGDGLSSCKCLTSGQSTPYD
ncbi:Leucine-rich repeat domain, L domain-like [Phytophthora cactorum]|nr:Leucine-rich repeat domain, L domain-like [Phytophthora cactorum]